MIKTTYQTPEIRDSNDNIIQQGAFGKNTPLSNSTNDGWIDYVVNNLEALHDTIGDSAATLDGNGHVVEPCNLAIGDEDGNRLKTSYLKLTGGTVAGTVNVAQNLKMQDNQENVFGGFYVPSSSSSSQYLALYGGESPSSNAHASAMFLYPVGDGRFVLRSKSTDNSTSYDLIGGSDGTLKWRGNTLAPLASPAFTGNPTAPTQSTNDNSTKLATTAYVVNDLKANTPLMANTFVTTLTNNNDLNDVKDVGTYIWYGQSTSPANIPTGATLAKMFVIATRASTYVSQLVVEQTTTARFGVWHRIYNGSAWSDWKKFAFAEDVLPLTGGTMTGNVVRETNTTSENFVVSNTSVTKGTNPTVTKYIDAVALHGDNLAANERLALIEHTITTSGTSAFAFRVYEFASGSNQSRAFVIGYNGSTAYSTINTNFYPANDNTYNLGVAGNRWKQLFAGTTTISTSDERLKENIAPIDDDVLDAWGEVGWYQYQFKESVEEKGETNARLHTGAIAQRIESVFTAHGLDANRYGLLCYDEWDYTPAERDENGNIVEEAKPAGNRYSLRYEEALCMEAAYQRRRADRLEARIEALERALNV